MFDPQLMFFAPRLREVSSGNLEYVLEPPADLRQEECDSEFYVPDSKLRELIMPTRRELERPDDLEFVRQVTQMDNEARQLNEESLRSYQPALSRIIESVGDNQREILQLIKGSFENERDLEILATLCERYGEHVPSLYLDLWGGMSTSADLARFLEFEEQYQTYFERMVTALTTEIDGGDIYYAGRLL